MQKRTTTPSSPWSKPPLSSSSDDGELLLPPRRKARRKAMPEAPELDDSPELSEHLGILPGKNPYDKAVLKNILNYGAAKQREEVRLVEERIEQAKIDNERARLDLEQKKLDIQISRGTLISKDDYMARNEAVISTFKELLKLCLVEMSLSVPANTRESVLSLMMLKSDAAFADIGKSVVARRPRDDVFQSMLEAFKAAGE